LEARKVQGSLFYTELVQEEKMEEVQGRVELKYCERCGGLWLRRTGTERVYCTQCEHHMRELSLVGYQKAGKRRADAPGLNSGMIHASGEMATAAVGGAF